MLKKQANKHACEKNTQTNKENCFQNDYSYVLYTKIYIFLKVHSTS